jgi:hypothetical protein
MKLPTRCPKSATCQPARASGAATAGAYASHSFLRRLRVRPSRCGPFQRSTGGHRGSFGSGNAVESRFHPFKVGEQPRRQVDEALHVISHNRRVALTPTRNMHDRYGRPGSSVGC